MAKISKVKKLKTAKNRIHRTSSPEFSRGLNKEKSSFRTDKKYFTGKYFFILVFSLFLILLVIFISNLYERINIAKVNGKPISRIAFYKELEEKEGNAVLEDLITKELIYQEAKINNISITQSDIDTEVNKIRDSVTKQGSSLEEVLKYQGVTYNQLLENVKIQKILEVLLKDNITIDDSEIQERYNQNRDVYGNEKTFEDLKEDIRFQIYQEKITSAYRNWIEEKRNSSSIVKYL